MGEKLSLGAWGAVAPWEKHYQLGKNSSEDPLHQDTRQAFRAEGGVSLRIQESSWTPRLGVGGQVFYKQPRNVLTDSHAGAEITACIENCTGEDEPAHEVVAQHRDFQRAEERPLADVFATLGFNWQPTPKNFAALSRLSLAAYIKAGVHFARASQKTDIGYSINEAGAKISREELPRNNQGDWYATLEGSGYPVRRFFIGAGGAVDFSLYRKNRFDLGLRVFADVNLTPQVKGSPSSYIQETQENPTTDYFNKLENLHQGQPKSPHQWNLSWGPALWMSF